MPCHPSSFQHSTPPTADPLDSNPIHVPPLARFLKRTGGCVDLDVQGNHNRHTEIAEDPLWLYLTVGTASRLGFLS